MLEKRETWDENAQSQKETTVSITGCSGLTGYTREMEAQRCWLWLVQAHTAGWWQRVPQTQLCQSRIRMHGEHLQGLIQESVKMSQTLITTNLNHRFWVGFSGSWCRNVLPFIRLKLMKVNNIPEKAKSSTRLLTRQNKRLSFFDCFLGFFLVT